MRQRHSVQRMLSSALTGLAVTVGALTVSALTGQPAASAAPLPEENGGGRPTSLYAEFTGWEYGPPRDGWALTHSADTDLNWLFSTSPLSRPPGSDGAFATVGPGRVNDYLADASLVSSPVDLTGQKSPVVAFDTYFYSYRGTGSVELSFDRGATWSAVWEVPAKTAARLTAPIPQAAGHSDVLVRFHYKGRSGEYGAGWGIDNVFVGTR
ncbi:MULTISPECIES: hypothetical protein [Actinomadura]|uniref:Uncharacterized protein n=1 Tax=Actinomadura yumaensis TaxID=111807 RepID=A0ABW2CQJ7_9ACTN|nr:hypothetical protein [Actinomadura sp. J1-007]MWK32774.1 hypothetical protein [Actinomadura sp. J1-007]